MEFQDYIKDSNFYAQSVKRAREHLLTIPYSDIFMNELQKVYLHHPSVRFCPELLRKAKEVTGVRDFERRRPLLSSRLPK